ncbi:L-rhamnose-binding lectin CSL3-like [Triplophysa dalaica]|uniref:L-rhamnose-binding lectin CSL3-like n=1 Tax=Triplophysa dalaica TaxID=1582913 RepID=UPI0024DFCBE8|nr:L-rhamnose-binding lectin CSL3-like [Triplophysa dalaica]
MTCSILDGCVKAVNIITCHEGISYLDCRGITYKRLLTCEWETAHLSCDGLATIEVLSANYGRTNSFACSTGRPASQLSNIQCLQTTSVSVMANICNGRQNCLVSASNDVFGDPCVGTFKYLMVTYSCVPICDQFYFLSTDPKFIKILLANYGRTNGVTCSYGKPASQLSNVQCIQSTSLSKMASQCDGKQNCWAFASHNVFGDPCVGTYKYLNVTYTCVTSVKGFGPDKHPEKSE